MGGRRDADRSFAMPDSCHRGMLTRLMRVRISLLYFLLYSLLRLFTRCGFVAAVTMLTAGVRTSGAVRSSAEAGGVNAATAARMQARSRVRRAIASSAFSSPFLPEAQREGRSCEDTSETRAWRVFA